MHKTWTCMFERAARNSARSGCKLSRTLAAHPALSLGLDTSTKPRQARHLDTLVDTSPPLDTLNTPRHPSTPSDEPHALCVVKGCHTRPRHLDTARHTSTHLVFEGVAQARPAGTSIEPQTRHSASLAGHTF